MRLAVLLGFALAIVAVNGGRFDRCKYWFEDIARHPIFTHRSPSQDFLKQHREGLIGMYQAIWNDRCNTEIDILGKNRASQGIIYKANVDLRNSFDTMRQYWHYREEPRGYFIAIWISYVSRFRDAVVAAYKNSANETCKKQIDEVAKLHPRVYSIDQAFEIGWRTFDAFDYCESNKGRLVLIEKLLRRLH
eukprot:TRINITY_DN940_c0_g1_i9.p1 TRINITY_DN940_c0_g1~~TRINITY_DN940_c0_g1_i9.p1  ORF type:complete len:191 (+),score=46.21 TRINITY_DN940_c0_g1_i9:145-717(+)